MLNLGGVFKKMIFNHSGSLGDVLYSLNFAREYAAAMGCERFDLNLQINVFAGHLDRHPAGDFRMSEATAGWLAPLLAEQPYIDRVTISPDIPSGAVNLDHFRELPLFLSAGDIRYYYYMAFALPLPMDFQSPILAVTPNARSAGRIVIFRSGRYHNPLVSYAPLRELAGRMLFLGLPDEHADFCREAFEVEYLPTRDALEAAAIIAGADLTIGNQTALFAIAEQLKVPRWLESCQISEVGGRRYWGCPNVLPIGGKCRMLISPAAADEVTRYLR